MVDAQSVHYQQVTETTSARLTDIERNLTTRPARERVLITVASSQVEREVS